MIPQTQLSDFVGSHGSYQLYITLILFVRYVLLGLMANSGSLMTPDVTFYCQLPMDEVVAIMPNITLLNSTEQELEMREEFKRICQLDLHLYQQAYLINATGSNNIRNGSSNSIGQASRATHQQQPAPNSRFNASVQRTRECTDFSYDIAPDQGRTMTSEFDLVCERVGLRSLFQSLISAAIVVAHVFWGTFSDKFGRFKAQKLCLFMSLISGSLSVFAADFWTFVVARALCSFADLGLVVSLTTVVVELVGNQYRGISVAFANFGNALGVAVLPYVVAYFEDFRNLLAFTVVCHLITMPFIMGTTGESIRWLLTNRKFKAAKRELKRIGRWNRGSRAMKRRLLVFCCCIKQSRAIKTSTELKDQDRISSSSQDNNSNQINSKLRDKRAKFELTFSKFIDQIESQNFCDPLGEPSCSSTSANADILPVEPETKICISPPTDEEEEDSGYQDKMRDEPIAGSASLSAPASTCGDHQRPSCAISGRDGNRLQVQPIVYSQFAPLRVDLDNELDAMESGQRVHKDVTFASQREIFRAGSCVNLYGLSWMDAGDNKTTRRGDLVSSINGSGTITKAVSSLELSQRETNDDLLASRLRDRLEQQYEYQQRRRHQHQKQPDCINLVANQLSFMGRVNRLFRDKQLMVAVFTIVWTTFNSELQYTSFIIINLEVGEDVYLNYILGGCMEALAAITASLLLSYASRRHTLIAFWLLISLSCFGLSVAHIDSTWAVWLLALAKFSQSCLSSVASVAAYESFPTFLRQSASGLVFTLGMLGSVFAPLIFAEFDDQVGMDRVLMTFSVSSLSAASLVYLYLKETSNCELN